MALDLNPLDPHWRYRNPKILRHAKGQPCQNCAAEDGTTVAAHSNQLEHGRGAYSPAHDIYAAYLCSQCHHWLDFGAGLSPCKLYQATRDQKKAMFDRAMHRTWFILVRDEVLK